MVLRPSRWESPEDVIAALKAELTPSQLLEIVHVSVDNPTKKLVGYLRELCLNFTTLSLCGPHLVFAWESCFGERKTTGSKVLKTIINKDSSIHGSRINVSKEDVYQGQGDRPLTPSEEKKLAKVENGTMSKKGAQELIDNLDQKRAFGCRGEYIDCMAALVRLFPDELKMTHFRAEAQEPIGVIMHA